MGYRQNRQESPQGRQAIWDAIRFMRRFSLEELEQTTQCSYPHIRRYVRTLLDAGYLRLTRRARKEGESNRYLLLRNSGPLPPIPADNRSQVYDPNTEIAHPCTGQLTDRDKAWAWIRQHPLQAFALSELEKLAGIKLRNAYKFFQALIQERVLIEVSPLRPGPNGHPARYRLDQDLGPTTPQVTRQGKLKSTKDKGLTNA